VHISQLASERVNSVEDVCAMGDELTVMVTDIDPQGKIRLHDRLYSKAGLRKKPAKKTRADAAAAVDVPAADAVEIATAALAVGTVAGAAAAGIVAEIEDRKQIGKLVIGNLRVLEELGDFFCSIIQFVLSKFVKAVTFNRQGLLDYRQMQSIKPQLTDELSKHVHDRDVWSVQPFKIDNFRELVEHVARLAYANRNQLLFYRGQDKDYQSKAGGSTIYPAIYRGRQSAKS